MCIYYPTTLSPFLTYTHPIGPPSVTVPLSHVLWVGVSGSVVDVHALETTHSGLKLVQFTGSFQEDNAEASSAANDWVQGAMSAAYAGV
jgi:hypothetical protein